MAKNKKSNKTSHVLNLITRGSHADEIERDEQKETEEIENATQSRLRHLEELVAKLNAGSGSDTAAESAEEQESDHPVSASEISKEESVSEDTAESPDNPAETYEAETASPDAPAETYEAETASPDDSAETYEAETASPDAPAGTYEAETASPDDSAETYETASDAAAEPLKELDLDLDYEPFADLTAADAEANSINDDLDLDLTTAEEAENYQDNLIKNIKKPDSLKDLINPSHDNDAVLSDIILQSLEEYIEKDSDISYPANERDIGRNLIIINNDEGEISEQEMISLMNKAVQDEKKKKDTLKNTNSGEMIKESEMIKETDMEDKRTNNIEAMNIISDAYYDHTALRPADAEEEDLVFINVMEELVRSKVDEIMSDQNVCTCAHCKNDVIAIALNKMPPKYVVTHKGLLYAKINASFPQFQTDLIAKVSGACKMVSENPRHKIKN